MQGKLKSIGKDLYKKQYSPKLPLPFFSKTIHITIKPLKIAAHIIFLDGQINANAWNFKIIPYNQEKYKLNMMRYFCGSVLYEFERCQFNDKCTSHGLSFFDYIFHMINE